MIEIEETELCIVCSKPGPSFYEKNRERLQEDGKDKEESDTSTIAAVETIPKPRRDKPGPLCSKKYDISYCRNNVTVEEAVEKSSQESELSLLQPHLRPIFLLQQIFNHPLNDKTTLETLRVLGDPSDWFEICKECRELVDGGIDVLRKMRKLMEEHNRIMEKLKGNFSSSYWGEPWNLQNNCILVRNEREEKPRQRVEFRNKIRKVETASLYSCGIKPEPEEIVPDLEDSDWASSDADSHSDCPSVSSSPNDPLESGMELGSQPISKKWTPKAATKMFYGSQESLLDSSTASVNEPGELILPVEAAHSAQRPRRNQKQKPGPKSKKSRKSEDLDNSEEDAAPKSASSEQKKKGRGTPLRKPTEVEHEWFYEKCEEYLDMSLFAYPPASNELTPSAGGPKSNGYFLKGVQGKGGFPCPSCDDSFTNKYHAIAHIQNIHMGIKKPWKCNQCPYKSKIVTSLRRHIQDHELGPEKICKICGTFTCRRQITLDTHIINHSKDVSSPSCTTCYHSFDTFQSYVDHMTKQHGLLYQKLEDGEEIREQARPVCQFCSKPMSSQRQLKYHLFKKHNHGTNDQNFPGCPECGEIFLSRFSLETHIMRSHRDKTEPGGTKFFCEHCGKGYRLEIDLKSHLRDVHTDEPQNCQVCGMMYKSSKKLRYHVTKFHPDIVNMSSQEVEEYVRKQNEVKPHGCNMCTERFAFSVLLFHHKRTFHNTGEFKCDICWKGFSRQDRLNTHKRLSHTTKTKVNCLDCGKMVIDLGQHRRKFCPVGKVKQALQGRQSRHTASPGEKLMCDICGKTFTKMSSVHKHKQLVHMNMRFECKDCGKSFSNLRQHRNKHCPMRKQKEQQQQQAAPSQSSQQVIASTSSGNSTQPQQHLHGWIPFQPDMGQNQNSFFPGHQVN